MLSGTHTPTISVDAMTIASSWACANAFTAQVPGQVVPFAGRFAR